MTHTVRTKRIYEPVDASDGLRVLVDGIWPRGVSKDAAGLHSWRRDVAHRTRPWCSPSSLRNSCPRWTRINHLTVVLAELVAEQLPAVDAD